MSKFNENIILNINSSSAAGGCAGTPRPLHLGSTIDGNYFAYFILFLPILLNVAVFCSTIFNTKHMY